MRKYSPRDETINKIWVSGKTQKSKNNIPEAL